MKSWTSVKTSSATVAAFAVQSRLAQAHTTKPQTHGPTASSRRREPRWMT